MDRFSTRAFALCLMLGTAQASTTVPTPAPEVTDVLGGGPKGTALSSDQLDAMTFRWLREYVAYIITDAERDAFLTLETPQQRLDFIERFWQRRDPTPGTPEN